jgi:hypothetical protein
MTDATLMAEAMARAAAEAAKRAEMDRMLTSQPTPDPAVLALAAMVERLRMERQAAALLDAEATAPKSEG